MAQSEVHVHGNIFFTSDKMHVYLQLHYFLK